MSSELSPAQDPEMEPEAKLEASELPRYIRFSTFQIDRQRQQVYQNGSRLKLQGKVYQVLMVLLLRQGEIVTREELKQALWPADTYVNYDANVNTTVNKLRQVLGDSIDKPLYIETIPRKGYAFVGQAEFSATPFPVAPKNAGSQAKAVKGEGDSEKGDSGDQSKRWLTLGVVILILTGILLGAGIAMLVISHLGPGTKPF